MKLGLHTRYPRPRPFRDLLAGTAIRRCVFRHYSSSSSRIPLPPFAMWPALPASDYYGGSAPPGPFSGRCAYPRTSRMPIPRGDETRWFPCSLWFAQRRRSPTVSQRPRHAYAAGIQRGLPDRQMKTSPGVHRQTVNSETRRVRPRSARFEPVSKLKDVTTPVPRVLLSATLADPPHLAVLDTSRLCQGCSRPPRHHPDQAALSYTALLRQDGGEGLSPPLEPTAPHGAAIQVDRFRGEGTAPMRWPWPGVP